MCQGEGTFCKTCMDNNCNQKVTFQTCYACNSETDSSCLRAATILTPKLCRAYTDTCTTVAIIGGRTERGCSSELAATSTVSELCSANNCNGAIYPADRKVCHQCSGAECSGQLATAHASLQICQNYQPNERCYAYVNGKWRCGALHQLLL